MPGFSSECMGGQHQGCSDTPGQCRCECHPWTRELMRKKVVEKPRGPKAVARGRARRQPATEPTIEVAPTKSGRTEVAELQNTCEKCGKKHPSTKHFCTECGSKLCLGQYCQRCEAPCDALDKFCGECGWNLKSPMSAPATIAAAQQPSALTSSLPPQPSRRLYLPSPDEEKKEPTPLPPGIVVGLDVQAEPKEQTEQEDPLLRLIREAQERGLRPAIVGSTSRPSSGQ